MANLFNVIYGMNEVIVKRSITLLQRTEPLALEYSPDGFHLAFSGGKDSQCLYHIAQMAGVKFKAHYQLTTLDPPELVKFIKGNYPDVIIHRPKLTFLQLCLKKHILPTQTMRFCCAELKESAGANTVTLTGVRRAESIKRSKRNEVEVSNHKFSGTIDQFNRDKESEIVCISGKDKIIVNPIIDWTDKDVWNFLNNVAKVPHCSLYDEGWHRIGCLFCPMASLKELRRMEARYPRYKAAFIRTIHKLREGNWLNDYPDATDEEVFQWWLSKRNAKAFFGDLKNQMKLF